MNQQNNQSGYILFGIVIGITILGISLTAAAPLWQKIVQRDKEQELIFRGYQYMQAIERYQRQFPGAYPPSVEILVEQKFLRKAYKDPFAENENQQFRVLYQLSPELQQQSQKPDLEASGLTNMSQSQSQRQSQGFGTTTRQLSGGRFQSTLGRGSSNLNLGGIVGVASISDEITFYKVPGKTLYKDWLFVYGIQQPLILPTSQEDNTRSEAPSPFPGLPPPLGLTAFRFGASLSTNMGPPQGPADLNSAARTSFTPTQPTATTSTPKPNSDLNRTR